MTRPPPAARGPTKGSHQMFRNLFNRSARLVRHAGKADAGKAQEAFDPAVLTLESRTVMSGTGFHNAIELDVNSVSGEALGGGSITFTGERFFRFTADQDGLTSLTVRPGSSLNATLEVYDAQGRFLARPALKAGTGKAEGMLLEAFEGRSYFVRVVGEFGSRGSFDLDIDGSRQVNVNNGDLSIQDRLDFKFDNDGWNFSPDFSGPITIIVDPTGSLNAQVRVFDEDGRAVTPLIDRAGSGGNEVLTLNLQGGQNYRVVVAGRSGAYGSYTITFDPHSGTGGGGSWTPISSTASASIDFIGDQDVFSFVAGSTGVARIIGDPRFNLNLIVRLYDQNGSLVAARDGVGSGGTEVLDAYVHAGRRYSIVIDGYGSSTGDYTVTLLAPTAPPPPLDDHADVGHWVGATRIPILNSSGNGLSGGSIETSGDTDLFKFTVAGSGTMRIRINPTNPTSGGLDSIGRLFDSRGIQIASADRGGAGQAEWITINVYAGETLFLLVDGYGSSRGGYDVEIDGPGW